MKLFILAALIAVALADSAYNKASSYESYARRPHSFAYDVKDDVSYVNMGHQESSDAKVVSGSYRVLLPDGRIQTVTYKDDGYGYVADVKYDGYAKYPEYKPAAYPTKTYTPEY